MLDCARDSSENRGFSAQPFDLGSRLLARNNVETTGCMQTILTKIHNRAKYATPERPRQDGVAGATRQLCQVEAHSGILGVSHGGY